MDLTDDEKYVEVIGSFIDRFKKLLTGVASGHLIDIVGMPVITRYFGASEYGLLAMFVAGLRIAQVVICGRYDRAILVPESEARALALTVISICISLGMAAVTAFLLLVSPVREFVGYYVPSVVIFLIPVAIVVLGVYQALTELLTRLDRPGVVGMGRASHKLFALLIPIGLWYIFGEKGELLIAGYLGGIGCATMLFVVSIVQSEDWANLVEGFKALNGEFVRGVARRYSEFPQKNVPSGLVETGSDSLPVYIIGGLFGSAAAGLYGISNRLLSAPAALIGQSSVLAFSKTAVDTKTNRRTHVGETSAIVVQFLAIIGLIPFGIVVFGGGDLVAFIFGAEWFGAGIYCQILAGGLYMRFVVFPVLRSIILLEHHDVYFRWALLRALVVIGAVGGMALVVGTPVSATAGYSVAQALMYIVALALIGYLTDTNMVKWRVGFREWWHGVAQSFSQGNE